MLYQGAWLACVLGAAKGSPWWGPAMVIPLAAAFVACTRPRVGALALLGVASLLGIVIDGSLVMCGALAFTAAAGGPGLIAPWMVALWVAFATTLPWAMAFLRGRRWLAMGLGALLGPLAYAAGARLGAVTLGDFMPLALAAIALGWGAALPLLVIASERLIPGALAPRPG